MDTQSFDANGSPVERVTNEQAAHIKVHADIRNEPEYKAPRVYSKDELLAIVRDDKHPEVRAIAGIMLYTMGLRDSVDEIKRTETLLRDAFNGVAK